MNLRRIALILFLACLLGGFICAQGARPALGQPADLVELDLSPDIAAWDVNVPNDGIALRVTGPRAFVYQATYASGDPVFFDFVDESGAPLADGVYNWEVVVTPSGALRAKREEGAARQQIPAYSGTFRIEGGLAVSPDINEQGLRPRDIIHNDDVIATFSLCVGTDCVNGESFGFDTIRLKENNLRIKFQDTSNSASFPTQDWQLTANDSANGGANKFSIDAISPISNTPFTIEAGAPSHSLYVDDGGRIGAGTSTPVVELHVVDGDTPTLRLEQNGSSGFAPQTWDVAGNETNFFVRDATNGSTLPFKIRPTAPSNALVIDPDGQIGMGAGTEADANLHIQQSGGADLLLLLERNGVLRYRLENSDAGTQWDVNNDGNGDFAISIVGSGKSELEIEANGQVGMGCNNPDHDLVISGGPACTTTPRSWVDAGDTNFTTSSSREVKENIVPLAVDNLLEKVAEVGVYSYDFIGGPSDRIGLIAEEFHTIFGRGSAQELSGHDMQMALWLAVQELIKQNRELEGEIEQLKSSN